MSIPTPDEAIDAAVRAALAEDLGGVGRDANDRTTSAVIPPTARARATMVSRENCIIAGLRVARRVFEVLDSNITFQKAKNDGERVSPGDVVFRAEGSARALLTGERTALNFAQRMSGIATLTKNLADAAGPRVELLHTRKTTPGLRAIEIQAVEIGGGKRHRFGLFDQILIKENHFALAGAAVGETVKKARVAAGSAVVGAEARNFNEAARAIEGGADYVLLDNYSPDALRDEVPRLREMIQKTGRRVLLEASGGITKDNIAEYAKTGVDRISVGALTHSARAVDLALDVEAI